MKFEDGNCSQHVSLLTYYKSDYNMTLYFLERFIVRTCILVENGKEYSNSTRCRFLKVKNNKIFMHIK